MNNIVPVYEKFVNDDGLEFVVDTASGLAYSSIRGTARILGVDEKTVRKYLTKAADLIDVINAEIPTAGGLQGADLIDAVTLYDMAFQYNLPLAKKMGASGANIYLLGLAGYKVAIQEAKQTPQTYIEALKETLRLAELTETQKGKIEALKEQVDELYDYSSIIRVAKLNQHEESCYQWRRLKSASELLQRDIKKAPCPRYGTKNLYPHQAWKLAYPEADLPTCPED